ncbi:MAG TPA: DUF2628 domain-containing protein [Burkholderiales bacterium]|jgi:hypothetical protein
MSAQNPYAPPKAIVDVGGGVADIDSLSVSDKWKRRFKVMRKAGGPSLPHVKNLTREEQKELSSFNVLAFLLGPLYYLFKGMWRKGLTLFFLTLIGLLAVDAVMVMVGLGSFTRATSFAAAAVYGALANGDYYRKMVLGQNAWW